MIEAEAPVRHTAFRHRLAFGLALVDRRQPSSEQHLAAELELLGRLVASIAPASRFKSTKLAFVQVETLGLPNDHVGREPQPLEIVADRRVKLRGRSLA